MVTKTQFLKDFITEKREYIEKVMVPSKYFDNIKSAFPNIDIEESREKGHL